MSGGVKDEEAQRRRRGMEVIIRGGDKDTKESPFSDELLRSCGGRLGQMLVVFGIPPLDAVWEGRDT